MILEEAIQQPGQREQMLKESVMESLHVAIPCEVVSYNETDRTIRAQPLIRGFRDQEKPQVLEDVPVFFPGNFTFDITPGDECLVVFADSCIDGWFQNGVVSKPLTARRHDWSDGFALVGFFSRKKIVPGINLNDKFSEIDEKFEHIVSDVTEIATVEETRAIIDEYGG